ncbi:MAG: MFS transporter [Pirellula sp.]|nr:MFS transporter [Pirellula sp.]
MVHASPPTPAPRWYQGVSRYQWLVLIIASAGWIFDVYEGQVYNTTRDDMLHELIVADSPQRKEELTKILGDAFLGIFLAGGMVGGLLFGMLGDRWGRKPTMIVTILMYSIFSGLTYFAQDVWQAGVLRFLVSMGIGGEWAVAAAMVSEVFPVHARAQASSIFHGSSTLGTWLAGVVAILVGSQWRYAYLVGVLPALLILWVRASIHEPEALVKVDVASKAGVRKGSLGNLFGDVRWRGRAIAGILLAAVGLATFWAVTVAGQNIAQAMALRDGYSPEVASTRGKFAYSIVQATGGGIGLIAFGPLCQCLGRRRAFIVAHLAALIVVPLTCFAPQTYNQLLFLLPFYGAFTFGMHAGYAVYFPELFPVQLRALGASVCFNGGRLVAAVILPIAGFIKKEVSLPMALTVLSSTYLLGLVVIAFLPETKNQPLPEA